MRRIYPICLMVLISGCSSAPRSVVDLSKVGEEEIIQSYGKHDDLKKSELFKVENHAVIATAMATVAADGGRPEIAVKIAQASARAAVAKTIESRLETYLQVASENSSMDSQETRELITEVSKLTANELKPGKTYYEKVKVYGDSGVPHTEYRAWAQVELDEGRFKKLVLDSIRRQEGKTGLSQDFRLGISKHWNQIVNADEKTQPTESKSAGTDDRKPASSDIKPSAN